MSIKNEKQEEVVDDSHLPQDDNFIVNEFEDEQKQRGQEKVEIDVDDLRANIGEAEPQISIVSGSFGGKGKTFLKMNRVGKIYTFKHNYQNQLVIEYLDSGIAPRE